MERPARPVAHHRRHAGDTKTPGALAQRFDHRKGSRASDVRHDDAAEAVLRTDRRGTRFPQGIIAEHLEPFSEGRAKELLITPNGVRIVWLLAEAERARYGVFRQAAFGEAQIDPALIERLLASLSALRDAINQSERHAP